MRTRELVLAVAAVALVLAVGVSVWSLSRGGEEGQAPDADVAEEVPGPREPPPAPSDPADPPDGPRWARWHTDGERVPSLLEQIDGSGMSDPSLVVEPGDQRPFKLLIRDHTHPRASDVYVSEDLTRWRLVANNLDLAQISDVVVGPDGTYHAYAQTGVYTSPDLLTWRYRGDPIPGQPNNDPGVIYEPETGRWHMHYSPSPDHSSPDVFHATSRDGLSFTPTSAAPILETGYNSGDFEVLRIGQTYHLFADNDTVHPAYNVKHWTGSSPTEFDPDGEVVLRPTGWCRRGIGDPSIGYAAHRGGWVMVYECWNLGDRQMGIGMATSPGPRSDGTYAYSYPGAFDGRTAQKLFSFTVSPSPVVDGGG